LITNVNARKDKQYMLLQTEDKRLMRLHVLCFGFCYALVIRESEPLEEAAKDLLRVLQEYSSGASEDGHEVITKLRDTINAMLVPQKTVEEQVRTRLDLIMVAWQVCMKKKGEDRETANLLDAYMRFRAKKERVGYELLSPDFYRKEFEAVAKDLLSGLEQYGGEASEDEHEVITKLQDAINAVLAPQKTVEEQVRTRLDLIMVAWQVFIKKNGEACKTANLLDEYMRFRAKKEGVCYELTPDYYRKEILVGVSDFFGIVGENGKLVCDKAQPRMFEQWKGKNERLHDGSFEMIEEDDADDNEQSQKTEAKIFAERLRTLADLVEKDKIMSGLFYASVDGDSPTADFNAPIFPHVFSGEFRNCGDEDYEEYLDDMHAAITSLRIFSNR
jgi:hypothetical protein